MIHSNVGDWHLIGFTAVGNLSWTSTILNCTV